MRRRRYFPLDIPSSPFYTMLYHFHRSTRLRDIFTPSSACAAFFSSFDTQPNETTEARTQLKDEWILAEDPLESFSAIASRLYEEPTPKGRKLAAKVAKNAKGWGFNGEGAETFYGKTCCVAPLRARNLFALREHSWLAVPELGPDEGVCTFCKSPGAVGSLCCNRSKRHRNVDFCCPGCLAIYKRIQTAVRL